MLKSNLKLKGKLSINSTFNSCARYILHENLLPLI